MTMQHKFDANQEFQLRAIEAVTGLFEGQPRIEGEMRLSLGAGAKTSRKSSGTGP
jgi:hypothetical protein